MREAVRFVHFGAGKLEDVFGAATDAFCFVGPGADANLGVEDEAGRAFDLVEFAVDAVEEFVAHFFIFVRKVAILTGAVQSGLWWF